MRVIIFGGTGTLGNEICRQLYGVADITIFSRDECKQQQMRRRYPKCRYVVGDIRDMMSLRNVLCNTDYDVAFHVAAMKHVDVCEENPYECLRTNVQGSVNVSMACEAFDVPELVLSSTDKAVDPINTYGLSKAICERYWMSRAESYTRHTIFRWGNVIGSRGSVIHTFAEALQTGRTIPITDREMSRFWLHIEDACRFMISKYKGAEPGRVYYPEMKAAPVVRLARATASYMGMGEDFAIDLIGIRPGEKIHECMDREAKLYSDSAPQYTAAELKEMVGRVLQ